MGPEGAKPPAVAAVAKPVVAVAKEVVDVGVAVVREERRERPWRSPLFYAGVVALAGGAVAYVLLALADRQQGLAVGVAAANLFAAGKESAIPLAIFSFGGRPPVVATALIWLDAGVSIAIFPWISAAVAGVGNSKGFIGGIVRHGHRTATRRRAIVDRFGGFGLFLFLIVPFAFNGPPVGMVLGRVVGLRRPTILAAVLAAIVATTAGWTFVYTQIVTRLPVPAWVPSTLAIAMAATAITVAVVAGRRERRREREEDAGQAAAGP